MLYVVRHGESVFNYQKLVCGISNVPLTEKGVAQAQKTGEKLKDIKFDYVFVSPLDRAQKTAEIILSVNEHQPPAPVVNQLLIERDAGLWEGDQRDSSTGYVAWAPDFDCEALGYETRQSVAIRVQAFLEEIGDIYKDKNVLVVAHNGIVRGFRRAFEGISYDEDWLKYGVANAGVVTFEWEAYEKRD